MLYPYCLYMCECSPCWQKKKKRMKTEVGHLIQTNKKTPKHKMTSEKTIQKTWTDLSQKEGKKLEKIGFIGLINQEKWAFLEENSLWTLLRGKKNEESKLLILQLLWWRKEKVRFVALTCSPWSSSDWRKPFRVLNISFRHKSDWPRIEERA